MPKKESKEPRPFSGAEIRRLREALQMTQQEFAVHIGLKFRGEVSRLETEDRKPTGTMLVLLGMLAEQHLAKSK